MKKRQLLVLVDDQREPTSLYLDEIRNRFGNLAILNAYVKGNEWVLQIINKTMN